MRIKVARVEREGMERGLPFDVCFKNFFHPNFQTRVQDVLVPLIMKDKEQEQPRLGKVPGYEAVAGLSNCLELTAAEEEVVVSLHEVLVVGAKLLDGSEVTAMAYKETDMHAAVISLMIEQNPNPNDNTDPSRYRHKCYRMVEQPTPHYSSRYRHDNTVMIMHRMNPLETTETNSRRGNENSETNETRNEGKARTAASGAAAEKNKTRKQKETEATADRPWRKKGTKQTELGSKVADFTSDSVDTREKKERSTKAKQKNQPESGYEVADLTQFKKQRTHEKHRKRAHKNKGQAARGRIRNRQSDTRHKEHTRKEGQEHRDAPKKKCQTTRVRLRSRQFNQRHKKHTRNKGKEHRGALG